MSNGKKIVYKGRKIESIKESNPEVLEYWDYEKNKESDLYPEDFSKGSHQKVWWKCSECGKSFEREIRGAIKSNLCISCRGKEKRKKQLESQIERQGSFKVQHPELMELWDWKENNKNGINPDKITPFSHIKANFICEHNHKWKSKISSIAKGHKCPYCGGQKAIVGENDIGTTHPKLLKYWDYSKNNINPNQIKAKSNIICWWKCPICNYEWQAKVYSVTQNKNYCPHCFIEHRTSYPEKMIFYYIKKIFPDTINNVKSNVLTWLESFELDIYIPSQKIAIEYDGEKWHSNQERDELKSFLCEKNGIKLIRIREQNCPKLNVSDIIYIVKSENLNDLDKVLHILIKNIFKKDMLISHKKDNIEILNLFDFSLKRKSIAISHPHLVKEWNYEKNKNLIPENFTHGSKKVVWWKCSKGHEWKANIYNRSKGRGCPVCSHKIMIEGVNDIKGLFPELFNKTFRIQWDYEKNDKLNISPEGKLQSSRDSVYWLENGINRKMEIVSVIRILKKEREGF